MFEGPIVLRANNMNSLYLRIASVLMSDIAIETILANGVKTRELPAFTGVVNNSYDRIVTLLERKISTRYLAGELCFYLGESDRLDCINFYSKFWNKVSDDGVSVNSAYGRRIFYEKTDNNKTQIQYVIDCFLQDRHTRKAVIFISDKRFSKQSKDNPCTLTLNFLIRDSKLHLIVNMRSNDVWFGFTYDAPFFMFVQEFVLESLKTFSPNFQNVSMGYYIHQAASMHVYEKDFDKLQRIVNSGPTAIDNNKFTTMPKLVPEDVLPDGFLPLMIYEHQIRVGGKELVSPDEFTPFQKYIANMLKRSK